MHYCYISEFFLGSPSESYQDENRQLILNIQWQVGGTFGIGIGNTFSILDFIRMYIGG